MVTFVTNPLWVLKTRMQLDSTNVHPRPGGPRKPAATAAGSAIAAARSIAKQEGARGFYRGLGPALLLCSHGAVQVCAVHAGAQMLAETCIMQIVSPTYINE